MARITVEDCLEVVHNRFSLVLVAAERSKQLLKGAQPMIDNMDENKEVVTALREIAAGKFQIDDSSVTGDDRWLPSHRQPEGLSAIDDELPPEA
ncbi:MAG: DNA-directed RNA polymerase subunit omega [Alphaproteobacteria bacterium]|nr:DNA-directed RNA polymerase subunit omega [Alphaproteobacteria bacterium]MCB9697411.1 DNA-directed RNA polymerase subunit omega [Alphaproteobacteria bacterium]